MSTAGNSTSRYRLQVNSYDRVSSLLIAMLYLIGSLAIALVIIFLFRTFNPVQAPPDLIPLNPKPRGEKPKGIADDIEPPGIQEAPDINEPQLQETLKELTNALTNKTAILSDQAVHAEGVAGKGQGLGSVDGTGTERGEGGNAPPKELIFPGATEQAYATMLDQFGVELAVLDSRSNTISFATNLSTASPKTRTEPYSPPKKFYFIARGAPLKPIEANLARKAGIMKSGALLLTLYPQEVANEIYRLEQNLMNQKGKTLDDIERTIYRVERNGNKYQFVVSEQLYF